MGLSNPCHTGPNLYRYEKKGVLDSIGRIVPGSIVTPSLLNLSGSSFYFVTNILYILTCTHVMGECTKECILGMTDSCG